MDQAPNVPVNTVAGQQSNPVADQQSNPVADRHNQLVQRGVTKRTLKGCTMINGFFGGAIFVGLSFQRSSGQPSMTAAEPQNQCRPDSSKADRVEQALFILEVTALLLFLLSATICAANVEGLMPPKSKSTTYCFLKFATNYLAPSSTTLGGVLLAAVVVLIAFLYFGDCRPFWVTVALVSVYVDLVAIVGGSVKYLSENIQTLEYETLEYLDPRRPQPAGSQTGQGTELPQAPSALEAHESA